MSSVRRRRRYDIAEVKRLPLSVRARMAVEIWMTYAQVRWLVLRRPITDVVETLRNGAPDDLPLEEVYPLGRRLGSPVVRTLAILPWDNRCLMRSLVMLRMMARRGVACRLVIGAQAGEAFDAHAWVEYRDEPLLPTLGFQQLTTI